MAFEVAGGKAAAFAVADALTIIGISNNLGDAKSLITHPETTTHQRLKPEQRAALGIAPAFTSKRSPSATSPSGRVSLADFRDAFPSKGAVLAGFVRRIDRAVLSKPDDELAREAPRERLFDMLMRRLDAMAPYREALREIGGWLGATRSPRWR